MVKTKGNRNTIVKCEYCDKWLIPLEDRYIHPPSPCKEEDGMQLAIADGHVNELFNKKYGKPSQGFQQEIQMLQDEAHKLQKEKSIYLEELQRIKSTLRYKMLFRSQ